MGTRVPAEVVKWQVDSSPFFSCTSYSSIIAITFVLTVVLNLGNLHPDNTFNDKLAAISGLNNEAVSKWSETVVSLTSSNGDYINKIFIFALVSFLKLNLWSCAGAKDQNVIPYTGIIINSTPFVSRIMTSACVIKSFHDSGPINWSSVVGATDFSIVRCCDNLRYFCCCKPVAGFIITDSCQPFKWGKDLRVGRACSFWSQYCCCQDETFPWFWISMPA